MGATRLDSKLGQQAEKKANSRCAVLDARQIQHLSPRGLTFASQHYLPEWTEVGVEMKLPHGGNGKVSPIECRGVVVQCQRQSQGNGFEVSLLFLDLPAKARHYLRAQAAQPNSLGMFPR
ncbi:MAG: PilZ domain-containing protein [Verrucomicrobiae bacterium]|nr:PilZ domain-containing protein [Verrucomicrobiae bacterium]